MQSRAVFIAALAIIASSSLASARGGGGHSGGGHSSGGSHSISGHFTSRGTYVAPAHATNPNGTRMDNWSTKGNVNPYTGKAGTKNPYGTY